MSASNKMNVALLQDEDIPTCFKIISDSFGHNAPFMDNYFPNHDTVSGQVQGSNRLAAWKHHAHGASFFLKAVTSIDDNGVKKELIIGMAVWTTMRDIPPQKLEEAEKKVEEIWPDLSDRRFTASLWEDYVKPRTQAVRASGGKGVLGKQPSFPATHLQLHNNSSTPPLSSRIACCSPWLSTLRRRHGAC